MKELKVSDEDYIKAYKEYMVRTLPIVIGNGLPKSIPYMDVELLHADNSWQLHSEYSGTTVGGILNLVPVEELSDKDLSYYRKVAKMSYPLLLKDSDAAALKVSNFRHAGNAALRHALLQQEQPAEEDKEVDRLLKEKKQRQLRRDAPVFVPGPVQLDEFEDTTLDVGDDEAKGIVSQDAGLLRAIQKVQEEMNRVEGTGVPLTTKQMKLLSTFNALQQIRPKHIAEVLAGKSKDVNKAIMSLQGYSGKESRNEYLAYHYAKVISALTNHAVDMEAVLSKLDLSMQPIVEFEQMRRAFAEVNKKMNAAQFRESQLNKFSGKVRHVGLFVEYPQSEQVKKIEDRGAETVVVVRDKLKFRTHHYKFAHTILSNNLITQIFNRGETTSEPDQLAEMRSNLHHIITHSYYGTNLSGFLDRLFAVMKQAIKSAEKEVENIEYANGEGGIYVFDNPTTYIEYFAFMGFKFRPEWAKTLPKDPALWENYLKANHQPVYVVNLVAEEGLPFSPYKKFECMTARMKYNREIYDYCQQPGIKLLRLRHTFPNLTDYVAKPKAELYMLSEPMTTKTAMSMEGMTHFEEANLFGLKTRTIGIPSCAAHLLNSLCAPVIKGNLLDRSYDGLEGRLNSNLFGMANFQFGGGKFDLLVRRITGESPFNFEDDEKWFFKAHFSDNIFICKNGGPADEIDPELVQISAYHPEYASLTQALQNCLEKKVKFKLDGLRLFLSGDGVKMESGTTARRASAFCHFFRQYVGYPDHAANFMTLVAPSLIAGGRLLVGDKAVNLKYMVSGNPLTFTMNDFASHSILKNVTSDMSLTKILEHAWENFGYDFGWERVVILPEMGKPLCPGSQILDLDLLGYAVYNADVSGEYLPILQPIRQDRMIISEKRGERSTKQGNYNKFLSAYFLGAWQRPAYEQLVKRILIELEESLNGEEEPVEDDIDVGIEKEIRQFMLDSDLTATGLSQQQVFQFFSGKLIFSRFGIGRSFIPSIPKIELTLPLYDPNSDQLYEEKNWRIAQRLLKTRLELAGLKIPTVKLADHRKFTSDLINKDPSQWRSIIKAVSAKPGKLAFWQDMAKVLANSHPELTTSYQGREQYSKMIEVSEREERKKKADEKAAEKKARQEIAKERAQVLSQTSKAPVVVKHAGTPSNITLNKSKVVLYTPVIQSSETEKFDFIKQMLADIYKKLLKVANFTAIIGEITLFGGALARFYDRTLKGSVHYKTRVRPYLFYIEDPKSYVIKDCNDVSLALDVYKRDMNTQQLSHNFRGEVVSYIVLHGFAKVATDMGVDFGGSAGSMTMMDVRMFFKPFFLPAPQNALDVEV